MSIFHVFFFPNVILQCVPDISGKVGAFKAGICIVACFVTILPTTVFGISWEIGANPLENASYPAVGRSLTNPMLSLLLWGSLTLKVNQWAMKTAMSSRLATIGSPSFFHVFANQKESIIFQVVQNV